MTPDEPWALTASVAEADAETRARLGTELRALLGHHRQWALLETCHRVELYGFGPAPDFGDLPAGPLRGAAAVLRLHRVAAGLESAVRGENEVLRQVRDALSELLARSVDGRLVRLFEGAIAAGHRARSEPPRVDQSLAERAVRWLAERTDLCGKAVLVAGSGAMGRALAGAASGAGGRVTLAGRDPSRSQLRLPEAAAMAPEVAAIGVALAGPWTELASVPGRLPPVADLSFPAAVPAAVRATLGTDYLGIDQLWDAGSAAGGARSDGGDAAWTARAGRIAEAGAQEYLDWLAGRRSVHVLRALTERGEARRVARVERLLRRLPELAERERELVVAMSRQLVTDLLHEPLSALRSDRDGSQGEAARRLFKL